MDHWLQQRFRKLKGLARDDVDQMMGAKACGMACSFFLSTEPEERAKYLDHLTPNNLDFDRVASGKLSASLEHGESCTLCLACNQNLGAVMKLYVYLLKSRSICGPDGGLLTWYDSISRSFDEDLLR